MMNTKKLASRTMPWFLRILLFVLVLGLGTLATLALDETEGLALNDLSTTAVDHLAGSGDEALYATLTDGKIFRSRDGGLTWEQTGSNPGVTLNTVVAAPSDPDTLYAGSAGGPSDQTTNLWISADAGQAWQQYSLKLPAKPSGQLPAVTALAVDPNQPSTLYVGTADQGIYRYSRDEGGFGYELFGGVGLPNGYVKQLVLSPDSSQLYALTTAGALVMQTTDQTWQPLETLPDLAINLVVDPTDPQILYAGTVGYGLYRSDDGGQSWQAMNDGLGWQPGVLLRIAALAVDPTDSDHLALATAYGVGSQVAPGGLFESLDGGRSWNKIASNDVMVEKMVINESGLYAVTAQGLERYGQPLPTAVSGPQAWLQVLSNPNGPQILILVLTILLATLSLAGRLEWFAHRKPGTTSS